MAGHKGQDDHRVFGTLGFVYRNGVGQGQLIKIGRIVTHPAAVIIHQQSAFLLIQAANGSDLPVEYLLGVVVAQVHDLVVQTETILPDGIRIKSRLQSAVQLQGPQRSLVHGGKHLNIPNTVQPQLFRNLFGAQTHNRPADLTGIRFFDKCELCQRGIAGQGFQHGQFPVPHPVCIGNDGTLGCLAENILKFIGLKHSGGDQVGQDRARPHGRQLKDIAHQNQARPMRKGSDQMPHQQEIHHGGFIDDHRVGFQGIVLGVFKSAPGRVEPEQFMHGYGYATGDL